MNVKAKGVFVRGLIGVVALAAAAASASGAEPSHEERVLYRKYEMLCQEVARNEGQHTFLGCIVFSDEPEMTMREITKLGSDVCKKIEEKCGANRAESLRERYGYFSQTLGCRNFGYDCVEAGARARAATGPLGDIDPIVEVLHALQLARVPVPPNLRLAIKTYVEARDAGRAMQQAISQVDQELKRFYADRAALCLARAREESAEQIGTLPPGVEWADQCTAEIDRKFQGRSADRVLNWGNRNSVVSQTTRTIIESWDRAGLIDRARASPVTPHGRLP